MVASLSFRGPHLERRRDDRLPTSGRVGILKMLSHQSVRGSCCETVKRFFSPPFLFLMADIRSEHVFVSHWEFNFLFRYCLFTSQTIRPLSEVIFHWRAEQIFWTAHWIKLASSWSYTSTLAQFQIAEMLTSSMPHKKEWILYGMQKKKKKEGRGGASPFQCFHRTNCLTCCHAHST